MEIALWGAWITPFFLLLRCLRARNCVECEEEFAERVGVIIGLYVKRISEGMGKGGGPGRGILGRCHADR